MVNLRSHLVRNRIGIHEEEETLDLTRTLPSVFVECYGGGGKGGTRVEYIPTPTPPPPAPPAEEPTMTEFTDEDEDKRTRKAMIQGAKSLQIPLGTSTGGTVGTA